MEFHENGQTYKELITVDKKNNILVYKVPKHNNRPETTFLEDFQNVSILLCLLTEFHLFLLIIWNYALDGRLYITYASGQN